MEKNILLIAEVAKNLKAIYSQNSGLLLVFENDRIIFNQIMDDTDQWDTIQTENNGVYDIHLHSEEIDDSDLKLILYALLPDPKNDGYFITDTANFARIDLEVSRPLEPTLKVVPKSESKSYDVTVNKISTSQMIIRVDAKDSNQAMRVARAKAKDMDFDEDEYAEYVADDVFEILNP